VTYAISALLIASLPAAVGAGGDSASVSVSDDLDRRRYPRSLFADARAGVREVASRPEIRVLLWSSAGVVVCIGVTSVGEVILARQVLHLGGTGLAVMITAGGIGMILGSLSARFTVAGPWRWRQVYLAGVFAMAVELIVCGLLHSPALVVLALGLGGFGNGAALVHDRLLLASSAPESLHGRLFSLQRMCVAGAFFVSFVGAGALISAFGVRSTLVLAGISLALVTFGAYPRLRKAWPSPNHARPTLAPDALA
jgi:hypothetical protein